LHGDIRTLSRRARLFPLSGPTELDHIQTRLAPTAIRLLAVLADPASSSLARLTFLVNLTLKHGIKNSTNQRSDGGKRVFLPFFTPWREIPSPLPPLGPGSQSSQSEEFPFVPL
jgi:hypothetical protein